MSRRGCGASPGTLDQRRAASSSQFRLVAGEVGAVRPLALLEANDSDAGLGKPASGYATGCTGTDDEHVGVPVEHGPVLYSSPSTASRSSAVSCQVLAAALASTCSGVVAPAITDATPS